MTGKIRKIILFSAASLVGLLLLVFLLISPIIEYIIEKHSKEHTGRVIRMEDLDINILTGSLAIEKLEILEADDRTNFVSCNSIRTSIKIFPALSNKYILPGTTLDGLIVNIIEKTGKYNFDDLIKRFASEESTEKEEGPPTEWSIEKFSLHNATINYSIPFDSIRIGIKNMDVNLPLFAHNSNTIDLTYAFELVTGGKFSGAYNQSLRSNDYRMILTADGFDLKILEQYLTPYIKLHSFTGIINSQLDIRGNVDSTSNVILKGIVTMKDMALLDPSQNPLMKTGTFEVEMDSVNTATQYYQLDHLQVDNFFARYEMYDDGDNWTRLSGVDTTAAGEADTLDYTNIIKVISVYINMMIQNYNTSNFYANHIDFNNAEVQFADYSLPDPFTFTIDQAYFTMEDLNTNADRIEMNTEMRLNKSGLATAYVSVDPHSAMDMDLEWEVKELPFGSFNPYTSHYAGYPFVKGQTLYKSKISIKAGMLKSENRFVLYQPKVGDRRLKSIYDVPLKLAVALLRDPKGNIDLEIPVEGNLHDPKYKLGKAIWKTVLNILTKAVTAPYNLIARAASGGADMGDISDLSLNYTSVSFSEKQKKKLAVIVKGLQTMPDVFVTIRQEYDSVQEFEALASVEARRRYALEKGFLLPGDTAVEKVVMVIDSISTKDSSYVAWLLLNAGSEMESHTDKCVRLIGRDVLNLLQQQLVITRNSNLVKELDSAGLPKYRYTFADNRSMELPSGTQPRFSYVVGDYPEGHKKE